MLDSQVLDSAIVFMNGNFVTGPEASVSIFDSGILYGDGIFDTLCARNGYVFKPWQHLDRLFRSAKGVRMDMPYTKDELHQAIFEVASRNKLTDAYIKCVITRGVKYPPTMDPRGRATNVLIFGLPYINLADGSSGNGIKTRISSVRRTPADSLDPRIKSLNYQNLVVAKFDAFDSGADEAILCDTNGFISEGPGYNIFMVANGVLKTPYGTILEGITRETVFEIAHDLNISSIEANISPFEMRNAEEVFFSTTGGGILPIVEVDKCKIGDGNTGPITRRITDEYKRLVGSGALGEKIKYRN